MRLLYLESPYAVQIIFQFWMIMESRYFLCLMLKSEIPLEGLLIVCILMQAHSQRRFLNCRNNYFLPFFFLNESILSVGYWLNMCKRFTSLYEHSWIIFDEERHNVEYFHTLLFVIWAKSNNNSSQRLFCKIRLFFCIGVCQCAAPNL